MGIQHLATDFVRGHGGPFRRFGVFCVTNIGVSLPQMKMATHYFMQQFRDAIPNVEQCNPTNKGH